MEQISKSNLLKSSTGLNSETAALRIAGRDFALPESSMILNRRPLFYRIWILALLITLTAVYPFSGYGANSSGARAALCKTIFTNTSGSSRSIPYAKASDTPDILMQNAVDLGHKIHNIARKENRLPEAELQSLAEIYYQLNDYHSSAFVLKLLGRHDLAKNIESLAKISDPLSVTDFNIARDTKPSQTPQQLAEFFRIHGGWIKEFWPWVAKTWRRPWHYGLRINT